MYSQELLAHSLTFILKTLALLSLVGDYQSYSLVSLVGDYQTYLVGDYQSYLVGDYQSYLVGDKMTRRCLTKKPAAGVQLALPAPPTPAATATPTGSAPSTPIGVGALGATPLAVGGGSVTPLDVGVGSAIPLNVGVGSATSMASATPIPSQGSIAETPEVGGKRGRPKAEGPVMSNAQKVAFSRYCRKENITSLTGIDMGELKSAWLLNPLEAKDRVLSSQSSQQVSVSANSSDSWFTSSRIAKEEGIEDGSPALLDLLSGLARKPSRFGHLAQNRDWDEYDYASAVSRSKKREKVVTTSLNQSTDNIAPEDVADLHQSLVGSSSSSKPTSSKRKSDGEKPHGKTPRTPKPPKSLSTKMGDLLKKTMKHIDEMQGLVEAAKKKVGEAPWISSLIKKVQDDADIVKEASKKLVELATKEQIDESEASEWESKMEQMLQKTSSLKLLKQAAA